MMKQLLLNQRKTGGRVTSLLVVLLTTLAMTLLPQRAWAARYDTSNMPTLESGTNVYKWSVYTTSLGESTEYTNQWTIAPGAPISEQQQTDVFSVYTGEYESYAELHGSATLTLQGPANNTRKIHKVAISGLQAIDSKEETISGAITVTLKNQNGGTVATFTQAPDHYYVYNLAEPVVWNATNYVEISFSGCEVKFYQLNVIDGEELSASDFSWPSELTDISNPTLSTENGTTLTYTGASGSFDFPLMYNNKVFTNAYYTSSASVASVGNGENVGKVTVKTFGSTTITAKVGDDDYLPLSFSYTLNVVPAAGTYNLFVANVQVTSDNASNIISSDMTSGTASFDASTNTLTLNGVTMNYGYGGIQSGLENLTVVFNGENTIYSSIRANTSVAGTHNLTLQMGTAGSTIYLKNTVGLPFIGGFDNVSMDGLYISSDNPYIYDSTEKGYVQAHLPKGYILQEATISSVPHYSLWIGGTQLTDENKADVFSDHDTLNGKVSFDSSTNTLSLNGAKMEYNVFSNLSSLIINVSGECSIGGGDSATAVRTAVPSTLTLKSTGTGNMLTFNNARCIRDFSSVTLSGLYWDDNYTYQEATTPQYNPYTEEQEDDHTGKQLVNSTGNEVGYAVASSEIESPKEFMYHGYYDGVYTVGFEGGGEIHYSIDYVDAELTDVENAVYNREDNDGQIVLSGPCTFTAWKVVGTAQSAPITAKLFGFAETEITAVKDITNDIPAVVPELDEGIEVMYSYNEDIITIPETGTTFITNTYGTAVISGSLQFLVDPDYTILNSDGMLGDITVTTVPAAPTFSLSPDEEYRGDQLLELSTTEEDGVIKYFIGEYQDNDNPETYTYTEPITLTGSTSVTAWVEVTVQSEAATTGPQTVKSEVVTREFNITPIAKYGIIIYPAEGEPVEANEDNCADVLGNGTVQFDGNSRLVLNGATLQKIETGLDEGAELELYLEGANTISGSSNAIIDTNQRMPKLVIGTDGNNPGSLELGAANGIIQGFQSAEIKQPLAILSSTPENATSLIGTTAAITSAHVGAPLGLIVDGVSSTPQTTETAINYSDISGANEPVAASALTNLVINNVLYTLNDDGTVGSPDGYDGSRGQIVLNSTMTDDYVTALNRRVENESLVPGSNKYAEAFNGLTFMVPAGTGTITLNTKTDLAHEFHLKVGGQDPITVINYTDNNDVDFAVDYAVSKSTYVYLYLVKKSSATAPGYGGHRAGPKATISGGIGGMKVESSSIAVVPEPSTPYYQMTASDYSKAADGSKHGIKVTNTAVTDLPDNAFATASPAPAYSGNRAPAGDISYIDLSETKITGKVYNRASGAFAGVPVNTVIYLPAGNMAVGPNFVIGGVCDDMQLDADTEEAFELSKDFTAAKASFDRSFAAGKDAHDNDKCYTVYLPYAVNIAKTGGEFFTCGEYNAATGTINMTKVTAPNLEANTAYIYKPAAGGKMSPMTSVKVVKPTAAAADPESTSEATGLHGVYEYHQWTSEPTNVYCFAAGDATAGNDKPIKAGQFVKVGSGTHIKPFRAYLRISVPAGGSAPEYVAVDWGNGTTSIVPLDKTQVSQDADGWYTITGFRLPAKPTEKGIYIHNNKKTIVK